MDDKSKSILLAACKVIFSKPNQTFYDLYRFLTDYDTRKKHLDELQLNENPLLLEHDFTLLDEINEKETVRNRTEGGYERYEVDTGRTDLHYIGSLLKRFELFLGDFRVKRLLSNPLSDEYDLSQVFEPGRLTIFYFPRFKYTLEAFDCLKMLTTLNILILQESQEKTPKPIHLMYDEIEQTPNTLKLLTESFDRFFKSNLCITIAAFNYESTAKTLSQLTPYEPEYLMLSKPTKEILSRLNLSHLNESIKELDWKRYQSLCLTQQTTPPQLLLKEVPFLKTILS